VPDSAAVPHLHGAHVPPDSDGDPMVWITRGQDADFYYPNGQLATTMWYHDHIMGRTRVNVYAGLVGTSFSSMETLSTPTFPQILSRDRDAIS
jgi:spore coat protein A